MPELENARIRKLQKMPESQKEQKKMAAGGYF